MQSLDTYAQEKLDDIERRGLHRSISETVREDGIYIERGGKRLLSFSCNDYLNLTQHPALKRAATGAIERYGVGSGASRLVTGNHPLYAELETRLARLKATEAAVVFGSGYLANSGIIPVLVGEDGLVLIDELSHACLWSGAQLSRGRVIPFRHNDMSNLERLLKAHRSAHPRAMIVTDGVFSMDGDLAPIPDLAALAKTYDAWLMTDDAHGLGVIGNGRGSGAQFGADVPLQMGTLSKAIGGYGGYLCASKSVVELMCNRARTLIYSTGLPPATIAAATAALDLIENDPALSARPVEKAKHFTRLTNLPEAQSPIVPIIIGAEDKALTASRLLADEGFHVAAIRPPTVPKGTSRLRLTFTAGHPDAEIERLATLVRSRILH
jgi:8-amino-7-oxononanoate synthase